MSRLASLFLLMLFAFAVPMTLAGCGDDTLEEAGEEADEAIDDTEDAVDDAADEMTDE